MPAEPLQGGSQQAAIPDATRGDKQDDADENDSSAPNAAQISPEELAKKPVGGEGGPIVPPGGDFDPNDVPALQDDSDDDEEEEGDAPEGGEGGGSLTEALLEELLDGIGEEEDWQNIG